MALASDGFVNPSAKVVKKSLTRFADQPYGKELFETLKTEFDQEVGRTFDKFEKSANRKITVIGQQVNKLESNMAKLVGHHEMVAAEANMHAIEAVDDERREKKILCQWLNGFMVSASHRLHLDPIDFAFARFALNMAIAAEHIPVQKMLDANVPTFLVGMLASDNDVVLGPSSIALAHLSLHDDARIPICEAGAIARLVAQCKEGGTGSPAVVTQLAKTMASLALKGENRQRVAGEGGMEALCELIGEATEFQDYPRCTNGARAAATSAMVNFMFKSDANRKLLVELNGIPAIVDATVNNADSHVIEQSVRALGNVSFNQPYTAAKVIQCRGVEAVNSALKVSDLRTDARIIEAGLICLTNLCNSEQNQTTVGAGEACKLAVHVCGHSESPQVLKAAARLVCALAFSSFVNKTRLGEMGAIHTMMGLCRKYGFGDTELCERFVEPVDWACKAIASLLLHRGNQMLFRDIWGIQVLVDLCLETEQLSVLYSASMGITTMTPTAEDRFDAKEEGRVIQIEQVRTFDALNRAKGILYGRSDDAPAWLTEAWEIMGMTHADLKLEKEKASQRGERMDAPFKEYFQRLELFEERFSPVLADYVVVSNDDLNSLVFQAF